MTRIFRLAAACALAALLAPAALAVTWFDAEVTCPLCAHKNTFKRVGSYGSYVYRYPSRYQHLYWPHTDRHFLYSCGQCRLTSYMWDFEKLPKEKHEAAKKALEAVKAYDTPVKGYHEIPPSWRMAVAEKVYLLLDKDEEFWCHFRRVQGFLLERDGKRTEAAEARKKALALAEKMLEGRSHALRAKELLVVVASMQHFTGAHAEALKTLEQAKTATYQNEKLKPENLAGFLKHLDEIIEGLSKMARQAAAGKGTGEGKPPAKDK